MYIKTLAIIVVIFVSLLSIGNCANLKLINNIDLKQEEKELFKKSFSTEFYNKKKQKLGKFYAIEIQDIISLPQDVDTNAVLIELETKNGQSILCSYFELSNKISVMPPLYLVDEVTGSVGDTIKISENIEGEIDYSELDKELKIATVKRIYCQISKITKSANLVFKSGTVIFPMDVCDRRWMTDVVRLKIYLFEK